MSDIKYTLLAERENEDITTTFVFRCSGDLNLKKYEKILENYDFNNFYVVLPLAKDDALKNNVEFDVKVSGKFYDPKLHLMRFGMWLGNKAFKLLGREKYEQRLCKA
jgi:hypothetical protein